MVVSAVSADCAVTSLAELPYETRCDASTGPVTPIVTGPPVVVAYVRPEVLES